MAADLSGSNSLADLAARIRDKAAAKAVKSGVEHAMTAGDLLIEAKAEVPHGQWLPWPVVGSNAARAPPQKKTSLEGAGCRQLFQRPRIPEIIHMNKRTLQGAGQESPANTSASFDPTNLRLPSEPPRRADGRLKGRSRDKLKSWEQDAAIAEVKEAQWQRFWNWIATAAIESPLVPKQPPGSHVRGSRWEQMRGMLIEGLGGAANLTQLQIGLVAPVIENDGNF
jgi:hypothetical protein